MVFSTFNFSQKEKCRNFPPVAGLSKVRAKKHFAIMHKILKIIFIVTIVGLGALAIFILVEEMTRKGFYAINDQTLFIPLAVVVCSIPAFLFHLRSFRLLNPKVREHNILDVSLDESEIVLSGISLHPVLWVGNFVFGLGLVILGILLLILIQDSPSLFNIRTLFSLPRRCTGPLPPAIRMVLSQTSPYPARPGQRVFQG